MNSEALEQIVPLLSVTIFTILLIIVVFYSIFKTLVFMYDQYRFKMSKILIENDYEVISSLRGIPYTFKKNKQYVTFSHARKIKDDKLFGV